MGKLFLKIIEKFYGRLFWNSQIIGRNWCHGRNSWNIDRKDSFSEQVSTNGSIENINLLLAGNVGTGKSRVLYEWFKIISGDRRRKIFISVIIKDDELYELCKLFEINPNVESVI